MNAKEEKVLLQQRKFQLKGMIAQRQKEMSQLESQPRSLFIRHLDCGSCNACEMELNALSNPIYDAGRWGIHFEASPRHADILVLTGPYVHNLDKAAKETLNAMPIPRIVTIGDCAGKTSEFENAYGIIPYPNEIREVIIAHIPGCPPDPETLLKALCFIILK